MKILLATRRFPGPFRLLARRLLATPGIDVGLAAEAEGFPEAERRRFPGLTHLVYSGARSEAGEPGEVRHALDVEISHGNGIAKAAAKLRDDGFDADAVVAASAGGAALFLRQVLPEARHLHYLTVPGPGPAGAAPGDDPRRPAQLAHLAFASPLAGLRHADRFVLPSARDLAQYPEEIAPLATIIPEAVDRDEIAAARPRPLRLANGTTVAPGGELVTVAAVPADAGARAGLARVLLRLLDQHPHAQVLLLLKDAAADALMRSLVGAPHAERVQAPPGLGHDALLAILKTTAVHVQPDPYGEAPSLLEAMAAGCPVVVPASGDDGALVRDGETGRLVPPGDLIRLFDPIRALLADRETARRLGDAASEDVLRSCDFDTVAWPAWAELLSLDGAAS